MLIRKPMGPTHLASKKADGSVEKKGSTANLPSIPRAEIEMPISFAVESESDLK